MNLQRYDFSESAQPFRAWHRVAAMPTNPSTYDLLMMLKPEDLSVNAWAKRAQVSRSWFNDVRTGTNPRTDTLEKVLSAIEVTLAQFYDIDGAERITPPTERRGASLPFRGPAEALDIPLVGTAQASDLEVQHDGSIKFVERMDLDQQNVVEYLRRPSALASRRDVYAITIIGDSCAPRYEDGDPAYVDPKRQPRVNDYVVVQLKKREGEDEQLHIALVKQLLRRTSTYIEMKQSNPEITFTINLADVHAIHRVIPWKEIVFF